jgi:hypothetical protein
MIGWLLECCVGLYCWLLGGWQWCIMRGELLGVLKGLWGGSRCVREVVVFALCEVVVLALCEIVVFVLFVLCV